MMKVDEKVASTKDRLKEAMGVANKKQADLARDTGLDTGSICHYLAGTYEPKQAAITKLAIALNVSEKWLLGYDIPKERTVERVASTKDRLKEAMRTVGKKQKDLAMETGISHGTISRYVSGAVEPRADAACKLASVLGVSEKWLWGYDVPQEQTIVLRENDDTQIVRIFSDEAEPVAEISYSQAIDKLAQIIEDKDFCELFESYNRLSAKNKQIVKRLISDLSV